MAMECIVNPICEAEGEKINLKRILKVCGMSWLLRILFQRHAMEMEILPNYTRFWIKYTTFEFKN